jgi:hypothetical protein
MLNAIINGLKARPTLPGALGWVLIAITPQAQRMPIAFEKPGTKNHRPVRFAGHGWGN